ncbi:hypothetical protein KH172YL63_16960 [Bacillus sp. KH172YL63]|nr:hypothetical protein KH172YL63_16960 [Bacillus sp. KH172YL63]
MPVPIVHQVKEVDRYAVMVLDWVDGKTVVQHLLERPGDAHVIGGEFGEMQAALHRLPLNFEPSGEGDWLTAETPAEKELFIHLNTGDRSYLHLDYHPLNVMLSERGIIDWTNFALGDYRFDLARTLSILEIHGGQYFSEEVLHSFITGWKEGYKSKRGSIGKLTSYIAWAGERMKRDLGDSMDKEVEARIDDWVHKQRGEGF